MIQLEDAVYDSLATALRPALAAQARAEASDAESVAMYHRARDRADTLAQLGDRLAEALRGMQRTHGMHGPCTQHNCSECVRAYDKARDALSAWTRGKGEQ